MVDPNIIVKLFTERARPWYHFWDPRSGCIGGLILGAISIILVWTIYNFRG